MGRSSIRVEGYFMEVVFSLFAVKRKSDPYMHSFALLKTELLNPIFIMIVSTNDAVIGGT